MRVALYLEASWTNLCNRENLPNMLTVEVTKSNEASLPGLNKSLHCSPGRIYIIFYQHHLTI